MPKTRRHGSDSWDDWDFFQVFRSFVSPAEDSLGHSTVVIIMTIVVAVTSAVLVDKFETFQTIGRIVGVSVSCSYVLSFMIPF